jgi:hypothetical protein
MLDVVRIVALMVAGSACLRPAFRLGLVVVLAIAAVDAPTMVLPIVHRSAAPAGLFFGFVMLFLGPSSFPAPATPWAFVNLVDAYPIARTVLTTVLAIVALSRAHRRARPLRPESPEARRWDKIGSCFLFVAVVDGIVVVADILQRYLGA